VKFCTVLSNAQAVNTQNMRKSLNAVAAFRANYAKLTEAVT